MFPNILNSNQQQLLSFLSKFFKEYYLVGGTALALQIGHRRSIDFDLFTDKTINFDKLTHILNTSGNRFTATYQDSDQFQGILNDVRLTFYQYPFEISPSVNFDNIFRMPAILDIAAMKAYALGRRAKWKDYVDLYFIFKYHHDILQVINKAYMLFETVFSEKLFRQQLCYFADIDHSEKVDFIAENIPNQQIQDYLIEIATSF